MAEEREAGESAGLVELLWGEKSEPTRGPKPALTLARIAQAAGEIADAEGLGAVSMQRVARACGVTTMALYRYVPGKAELIALMIDLGLGASPSLGNIPGGWRPKLDAWARLLWGVFLAHPWSLAATAPVRAMGPNEMAWLETAVAALAGTKLPGSEQVDSVICILGHTRTMAQHSLVRIGAVPAESESGWDVVVADILARHGERFPALRAAAASGAFSAGQHDAFEIGLCLLLDGLEQRIAEVARVDPHV